MTKTHTSDRIADRLVVARRRRFVGREAELELFRTALADPAPPFTGLFVHGPGGVGKSTLLSAMADAAADAGVAALRLDLLGVEPSPPAFTAALGPGSGAARAVGDGGRFVLLLDTFEQAAPLEAWLRERFLPELPADALVVIAGRRPPAAPWAADPAWRELMRVVSLRNLGLADVRAYLARASLAEGLAEHVADVTYGHPLALALLADVIAQRAAEAGATDDVLRLGLADAPDVVGALVALFVEAVPGEQHRRALEVCAQARVTTEELLRAVLEPEQAAELFTWLRSLSFVEESVGGLAPHDLARDVLAADLRWRDPQTYATQHKRVHDHAVRRIQACDGAEQQRVADLVFLHAPTRSPPPTGTGRRSARRTATCCARATATRCSRWPAATRGRSRPRSSPTGSTASRTPSSCSAAPASNPSASQRCSRCTRRARTTSPPTPARRRCGPTPGATHRRGPASRSSPDASSWTPRPTRAPSPSFNVITVAHTQRRRYERLRDLPQGLLVAGDAICSFNPLYGQGMTVAAAEARALRDSLAGGTRDLARRCFAAARPAVDDAWRLSTGADLALPVVAANAAVPVPVRAVNAYLRRLRAVAEHDPRVAEALVQVIGMRARPPHVLRPATMRRVLRGVRPAAERRSAARGRRRMRARLSS